MNQSTQAAEPPLNPGSGAADSPRTAGSASAAVEAAPGGIPAPTAWSSAAIRQSGAAPFLYAVLVAGLLPRLWLSLTDDGIFWPDEIYQSLEPAHRLVFGFGGRAWEFTEGARNWTFPAAIALIFKLCAQIGLEEPRAYTWLVKLAFCLIAVATILAVERLARANGARPLSAAIGGLLFALAMPAIYFAPRALSECASALPITLGLLYALPQAASRWRLLLGASLLGFATLLRLQSALVAISLLLVFVARRDWRAAGLTTAILAAWAVLYGLIDWLTWGSWFQSVIVYIRFNTSDRAREMWAGAEPLWYYLTVGWTSTRLLALPLVLLPLAAARKARGLFWCAASFALLHSLVEHKELRFLLPVLPLFAALAAVGLEELLLLRSWAAWPAAGGVTLLALWSFLSWPALTFGDLGQWNAAVSGRGAFDDGGPVNRLLLVAHDLPDLCGLKLEERPFTFSGGYTYLHRRVRIYSNDGPGRESGFFNYAIVSRDRRAGGELVAEDADQALLRIRRDGCLQDPSG